MAQKVEIEIRLDNRNFSEGANKVKLEISAIARQTESEGGRMGGVFDNLEKKIAGAFAISKVVEFEKKIISVRSEMESLQKSFESLAGEQIGRKLYEDIKQFATTTPMMMNDLAKGAQTLLGFNIEAEKVMPILREIGDISKGDAQKFNSLTLAFAQMSSTGKLMGQDLLQMINAGFNPLVTMSEKSGKSVAQLKDEMSKGLITVEMVEDAFRTATAEGGKFHNMLEAQSKTMKGALSNLQGAYNDMLNEIGEKQQGLMLGGVELAQSLVKNYEKVGQVLLGIIATYGTYRAAVMTVNIAEGIHTGKIVLKIRALRAAAAAQALLNKTMLLNPYVLAATALGVLVGSIIATRDGLTDAERAQRDYNKTLEDARQRQKEYNDETQDAIRLAQDDSAATEDREGAMQTLIARYPEIIQKYIDEKGHLTDILNLKREIAAYDGQMANEDNKVNADLYKKYIDVINKWKRGEKLTETERILYDSANKRYGDATPWYNQFSGSWTDDSINYFTNLWKQAQHAYGRGKTGARIRDFMEKMGGMKTDELKKLVESLSSSASRIKKDNQVIKVNELNDFLSSSDLQGLITKANGIINARTKPKKELTYKEKAAAQKAAEAAAARRQKLFEIDQKQAEEQAAKERELNDALANLAIASEANNARREIMQMEKDHQDKVDAINRQAEEWKKAAYKAAEERFNATNADKTKVFSDTAEGKAGWKGQSLTEEQTKIFEAQLRAENTVYSRYINERYTNERQQFLDYIKEYGDIQAQKAAITEEYDRKIANADDAIQKAALEKQKERLIAELDMKELQESINWEEVFNDLERQSTGALRSLKEKLEKALDAKDITVENAKILAEKIRETEDLIAKRTDMWTSWIPGLRERQRRTLEILEIEKEIRGLQTANSTASTRQADALKNFTDLIGIDPESFKQQFGEINAESLKTIKSLYNIDASSEAVREAFALLTTSTTDLSKSQEELKQARANRERHQNALKEFTKGGDVAQYFKDITAGMDFPGYASLINQNVQSMAKFTDKIGLAGTDFGDAVHGFADGVGGFNNAIQSLQSGDVFGAVNGVIDGLAGFGKSLTAVFGVNWSGGNEEEHDKLEQKLIKANENLEISINKLKESFDKANGIKAIELSNEIIKKQQEANNNIMERWKNDMGYHSAHHSNAYNWEGFSSEQIRQMNALLNREGYSERVNSTSWEELSKMTPEALAAIRRELPEIWDFITSRGNYSWVYDSLNEYADQAGKIAEQEKALMENLTQLSESSLHDQFLSELMDMEKSAEDFGSDFSEILMKAVLNAQIGNLLDEDLNAWRKALYKRQDANGGTLTDTDVEDLRRMWDAIVEKGIAARDQMAAITGYGKEVTEEAKKYFESLRDTWKSMLTDMKSTAEDWKDQLLEQVFNDLVDKLILDAPVEVMTGKFEKHFDNFSDYLTDWSERYRKVMEDATLTDEERNAKLAVLLQEQTKMREKQVEKAKELASGIGYEIKEEFSNSLDNLGDTLVDSLLDAETDAEEMGAKIGQALVKELLNEMLASEKYADQMAAIKKMWQDILSGITTEHSIDDVLAKITDLNNAIAEDEEITKLTEAYSKYGKAIEDANKKVESSFGDLHDSVMDVLLDMDNGAEGFAKKLNETVVKDLIDKEVFGKAFELNGKVFDNFDAYQTDWTKRYLDALERGDKELLKKLVREMQERQAAMATSAEEYAKELQEIAKDTTFTDLTDDLMSALQDTNTTFEDWAHDIGLTMAKKIFEGMAKAEYLEPLMQKIQNAWNTAVEGATSYDEKGNSIIDWKKVTNNDGLTNAVSESKDEFDGLREAWNTLLEAFNIHDKADLPLSDLGSMVIESLTDSDTENAAENFGKKIALKLMNEMLSELMDRRFGERMEEIRERWQDILSGKTTEHSIDDVLAKITDLNNAIAQDEEITDLAGSIRELSKEAEGADETFKDMSDSWTSLLTDMDSEAADWGRQIGKTLVQKLVKELVVGRHLQSYLNALQTSFDSAFAEFRGDAENGPKKILEAVTPSITAAVEATEAWIPVTQELAKAFEKLDEETTPLDDLRSRFRSELQDMSSDGKDFAKDLSQSITEAMIDAFVLGDAFDENLEYWKQQYREIKGSDKYSDEERAAEMKKLQREIIAARDGYVANARELQDLLGYGEYQDQSATVNMADKATYDQFELYLGIAMSQQTALEQGNVVRDEILATLRGMSTLTVGGSDDLLQQAAIANSHLELIRDYLKTLRDDVSSHLCSIDSKLTNINKL